MDTIKKRYRTLTAFGRVAFWFGVPLSLVVFIIYGIYLLGSGTRYFFGVVTNNMERIPDSDYKKPGASA